jgi:hypothetical protein
MAIILEMICKNCDSNDCSDHQPVITKLDSITGLEFEIRCICKKRIHVFDVNTKLQESMTWKS